MTFIIRFFILTLIVFALVWLAVKVISFIIYLFQGGQTQTSGGNSINIQNGSGVSISNQDGDVTINGKVKDVSIINTGILKGVSISNRNGKIKLKGKIKSVIVNGDRLQ